ncbi:MAG: hypothetical protein HYY67_05650 [Thaumarchaeota archaeon]|nr:hypothetical protein [Nitrososphaerota archaeon]
MTFTEGLCAYRSFMALIAQLEKELKGIRNELRQLRLMYKQLAEKVVPVVEPDEVENKAIRQQDKIVSEKELLKAVK